MSSWFEIALPIAAADADAATGALAEHGYPGSELRELDDGTTVVVVYTEAASEAAAFAEAARVEQALRVALVDRPRVAAVDENVWRESWKLHFPRVRVGRRFEIVPPWESTQATEPGRIVLVINPAMAFGTGHHETTTGCMEALEEHVKEGDAVADVGCGSGILAIAAAKLGASRVVAVDNDPEAVNAALSNIVINEAEGVVDARTCEGPPESEEGFDLVVANILAASLLNMRDALTSCVKECGVLVLSGIESDQRHLVEVGYRERGWHLRAALERGEWVTLVLGRLASREIGRS